MSSFDGNAIFGICKMKTGVGQRDRQYNSFFGLQGTESLDGGFRQRTTAVDGLHYAADVATLVGIQDFFRSYEDGRAYVLVDTKGRAWANVELLGFTESGDVNMGTNGTVFQRYTAEFLHLSFG